MSSQARVSSQSERRSNDNPRSRPPSALAGTRNERPDVRRRPSPPPGAAESNHRRAQSSSQRSNRGVDERRTERVHISSRETVTSRTRSPDRRAPTERPRANDTSRSRGEEIPPKASKVETQPGKCLLRGELCSYSKCYDFSIAMGSASILSAAYNCAISVQNLHSTTCFSSSTSLTASAPSRIVSGSTRGSYIGGSSVCFHGI